MKKTLFYKCSAIALGLISAVSFAACGEGDKAGSGMIELECFDWGTFDGAIPDSIQKKLAEETGVDFYLTGVNGSEAYNKQLTMRVNTNDAPEVFFYAVGTDYATVNYWAEQGVIRSLDELATDEYPHLKAIITSNQYANLTAADGKHYFIPRLEEANNWGIYMREDWIKNLQNKEGGQYRNVKTPAYDGSFTLDDFEYLLEAFTKGDPDGNGKDDTYGISMGEQIFWGLPLMRAFCDFTWSVKNTGGERELVYGYSTEEFKEYLTWMHGLYEKGYIDPTFYENTTDQILADKFKTGKCGLMILNGGTAFIQMVLSNATFGAKDLTFIAPPKGTAEKGIEGSGGFNNFGGWYGGWFISNKCRNVDNALKLLDYIFSPEGSMLINYGIEGVHYSVDENGSIIPNLENRDKEPEFTFDPVTDAAGNKLNVGRVYWATYITMPIVELTKSSIKVQGGYYGTDEEMRRLVDLCTKVTTDNLYPISDEDSTIFNFSGWSDDFSLKSSQMDDLVGIYATCMITGNAYENVSDFNGLWSKMIEAITPNLEFCKQNGKETLKSLGRW